MRRIIPDSVLSDPSDPRQRAERDYWEIGLVCIAIGMLTSVGAIIFVIFLAIRALV